MIVVCGTSSSRSAEIISSVTSSSPRRTRAPDRARAEFPDSRNHFGDRGDVLDAADEADLECCHRHVFEHATRLVGDPLGIERHHFLDAHRVLYRDCGNHRQRVAPMLESVITSACKPAPPLGSVAANASTIGGSDDDVEGSILRIDCEEAGCIVKCHFSLNYKPP
jgi:hypothetical protein